MNKTKIVFMGTPDFAVKSLEALYKNDYDIKLVVTQQDKRRGRGKKLQYTEGKEKADPSRFLKFLLANPHCTHLDLPHPQANASQIQKIAIFANPLSTSILEYGDK